MKTPCYIFGLIGLCALLLPSAARAQDAATVVFTADSVEMALHEVPWRFHAGDDAAWADPAYDDSDWQLVEPGFPADSLETVGWTGIGWFRLRLVVDSMLQGRSLVLGLNHVGASEVYFDGEHIQGFGTVGTTPAAEERINVTTNSATLTLPLGGRTEHLLAVRYSHTEAAGYSSYYRDWFSLGFRAWLARPDDLVERIRPYARMRETHGGLQLGILLLMFFSHLMLYVYARRDRTNLYFSLFAAFFSACLVCFTIARIAPFLPFDGLWLPVLGWGFAVLGLLLLLRAVYALFYDRLPRQYWVIAGLVSAGMVLVMWRQEPTYSLAGVLLFLEMLRVVGRAIWKKQPGGWIVGLGVVGMVVGFLLDGGGPVLDIWGDSMISLSFPLSMSVLLGLRFARTNQRLEKELENVQTLSERTLEQEREKQQLIARQNERLEAEVAERTAALRHSLDDLKAAQAQLVQQEKMASLGELTAGIAHEIKNPLNFVTNFSSLSKELVGELEEETDPQERQALLADLKMNAEKIEEHGRRADGIVKSMMAHARTGSGEREQVNLNALVEEHVDLAYHGKRAQVPDFDAELVRDLGEDVGRVEAVPQELGRVVLNLVGNAFDAVTEHAAQVDGKYAPRVAVSTRRVGEEVELRVEDNGPGIPAAVREQVFEPFFTTKDTGKGTGLGLSMSHDIVMQGHGGTLAVESAEGEGAAFVVRLPATPASVPQPAKSASG